MKFFILQILIFFPLIAFAENKVESKFLLTNIKVKENNSIGKTQDVERSVLLDSKIGQTWLFVRGKNDDDISLVPIPVLSPDLRKEKVNMKRKSNGGN